MKAKIILWLLNIWNKSKRIIIYLVLAALFLTLSYITGCSHGRKTKQCPQITSNTVYVHDTITRTITNRFPYYVYKTDTVIYDHLIPADVDTALILKNYFATYKYDRYWAARDTLEVFLTDYISENKPVNNVFRYRWLLPQTITTNIQDNTVTYNSYLYVGGSVPVYPFDFKYSSIDLTLTLPKWYVGVGYLPGINVFVIKGGVKLLQFKQKK